jgi:hypothetical protein
MSEQNQFTIEHKMGDARTTPSEEKPFTGIGGAPTRATTLPTDGAERKKFPMFSGLLAYFPDALAAVAHLSWKGNQQHNPGKPLHWDRSKSQDEEDTLVRHLVQSGTIDTDGIRHSAKVAWRALAMLQKEIEADAAKVPFHVRAIEKELDKVEEPKRTFRCNGCRKSIYVDGMAGGCVYRNASNDELHTCGRE